MWKRVQSRLINLSPAELGWGSAIGILGLLGAWLFLRVRPGRMLGNPMPLILGFSSLGRALGQGLTYFNLRDPLLHLGFVALLAGASGTAAARRGPRSAPAAQTIARIAVGLNLIVSALLEVDALIVLIFYVGAGFLSLSAAGLVARWMAERLT